MPGLCRKYEYLTEGAAVERIEGMSLDQNNYQEKYHLLVYLDEMEHSRKMIHE